MSATEPSIADDILPKAEAIGEFIGEPDKRRTYYLLETRQIPAGKRGNNWIGSKRRIREHYERLTAGEAA